MNTNEKIRLDEPAFPVPDGEAANHGCYGMSLRDYFAAQALAAMALWAPTSTNHHEDHAVWAYSAADAMIRVRSGEHLHKETDQ